jgi:hypothetical protein
MQGASGSVWTSLKIAKLLVQLVLPLVLFGLGVVFGRRAKAMEEIAWRGQKSIEWRQSLYERTIGEFNKLYCSFTYVGDWEERSAPDVIKIKRTLDRELASHRLLMSRSTWEAYTNLMNACFVTEGGRGQHIRLKANVAMYEELGNWESSSADMFVPEAYRTKRQEFCGYYDEFILRFYNDIGIHV